MLVDSHCHLDLPHFDADREAVIERARAAGVMRLVTVGTGLPSSRAALALAERYEGIYAAVGVHPHEAKNFDAATLTELEALAQHPKVVAIGEIGLDFYRDWSPRDAQSRAFEAQLDLAIRLGLPIIVHDREAHAAVLATLRAHLPTSPPQYRASARLGEGPGMRGVLHSFSGDTEVAQAVLALGLHLGFTGPVTFPKAANLRAVVAAVPLERLLIETDAPYLTPQPYRGQRNEPAYVRYVAEGIAAIKGLPFEAVAQQTTANAEALFFSHRATEEMRLTKDERRRTTTLGRWSSVFRRSLRLRGKIQTVMPPDLSIVIVSWNVRELLRRCLRTVVSGQWPVVSGRQEEGASLATDQRLLTTEVIVVDNASSDGSVAMVAAEFPQVRLIANAENRGFTGGNNQGIAVSHGRYIMLLNPDTEVVGDALAAVVAYMDTRPEVGALGPQLLYPDGSVQSSRRRFPTFLTALFESTWLQPWAPPGLLERYYVLDRGDDETSEVDWVMGACLVVRREVIEQVGGLDEGLFMYSDEPDWCKRIKDAGWKVVYFPAAQVIHHEGKSSEQVVPARHIYFQTSKVRYFRKYHGPLAAGALRLFLLALYGQQLALEAAKAALGHKRPLRRQRVAAYWQVLRSGLK